VDVQKIVPIVLFHLTDRGEPEADATFLLLLNASHEDVTFVLPAPAPIDAWQLLINTAVDPGYGFEDRLDPGSTFDASARSLVLLVRRSGAA
jgi:glycogen operon protein